MHESPFSKPSSPRTCLFVQLNARNKTWLKKKRKKKEKKVKEEWEGVERNERRETFEESLPGSWNIPFYLVTVRSPRKLKREAHVLKRER